MLFVLLDDLLCCVLDLSCCELCLLMFVFVFVLLID